MKLFVTNQVQVFEFFRLKR